MASKKVSAGDRAAQFLAQFGTAGGPIGSPALAAFGAGDLNNQIQSGVVDQYAAIRGAGEAPAVGHPNAPQPMLPQDLYNSYLKLNLPGSPLPRNGLLSPQMQRAAESAQNMALASEQYSMTSFMPPTGQLPVCITPPIPQKKGGR